MILLDNYSKKNTFINITTEGYSIIDTKNMNRIENGEGGFSEDGELLGLYIDEDELYFQYNDKRYKTKPDKINCTNKILNDGKRNFKVKINDLNNDTTDSIKIEGVLEELFLSKGVQLWR